MLRSGNPCMIKVTFLVWQGQDSKMELLVKLKVVHYNLPLPCESFVHCACEKNINRKIYMLMPPNMLFKKRCFVFYFCKVKMQKKPKEEEEKKATLPCGRNVIGS